MMTTTIGPHKRRGRRRRRLKAVVLSAAVITLLLVSSWVDAPARPEVRELLSASELGYLCNVATYSPGSARDIREQYPAFAPEELERLRQIECNDPGRTAALMEMYGVTVWGEDSYDQ